MFLKMNFCDLFPAAFGKLNELLKYCEHIEILYLLKSCSRFILNYILSASLSVRDEIVTFPFYLMLGNVLDFQAEVKNKVLD